MGKPETLLELCGGRLTNRLEADWVKAGFACDQHVNEELSMWATYCPQVEASIAHLACLYNAIQQDRDVNVEIEKQSGFNTTYASIHD